MIHISALLFAEQVPKTLVCTKNQNYQQDCVHCHSEQLTDEMRQKLIYSVISVDLFYGFWKCNAVTNKGQDPGPPGPIVPYKDRMGSAKDLALIKWRNEDGYECEGSLEAHQQSINASLRETSQDVEAREKGDKKEPERRQNGALSQNKKGP